MAQSRFAGRGCDGAHVYPHPYGCSQMGDDHSMTQKFLRGLVQHPNAAGVLVIGSGCENNNIAVFQEMLGVTTQRVRFMNTQDAGDEVAALDYWIN